MKTILRRATSTVLSLALVLPLPMTAPAYAQGEAPFPTCTDRVAETPIPCLMNGNEVQTKEQWRIMDLILRGEAQNVDQARAVLAERRAARKDKPQDASTDLPACGNRAKDTPLPCTIGEQVVKNKKQWRIYTLIAKGEAGSVQEARTLLEARRAETDAPVSRPRPSHPACGARANATPLPCMIGDQVVENKNQWRIYTMITNGEAKTVKEARAILKARQAEADAPVSRPRPSYPACGDRANNTPLPCSMGEQVVETKYQWRIYTLIARGEAQNVEDAKRILRERREAREQREEDQVATNTLPTCGDRASNTDLPCQMGNDVIETREQWRVFDLIHRGRASSVEEARERLAARRTQRREATAATEAGDDDLNATDVQTVQESDVRDADEEFATRVTRAGRDSGGGLSKFEKVLLLGLGAVVVGSVLKNGDKVVSRTGDRVVVETPDGDLRVLKDDAALLQRPGDQVQTRTFDDGSSRTIVRKPDGSRVITVLGRDGSVLQRIQEAPDGTRTTIIDDTADEQEIVVEELPDIVARGQQASLLQTEDALRRALASELSVQQRFSLRQVREVREVRALAPELELDAIRFASGSAAIRPEQARALARLGVTIGDMIQEDPTMVLLVEGHTDAVGDATYNLALSDRRAETVALALTEYFGVPAANMITQGYGETQLKVPTLLDEAANRRAVVRNITGLLR